MFREKAEGIAPTLPARERERRLERARELLRARGIDGMLIYGDGPTKPDPIRYLTGLVHVFPRARSVLLLPREEPPILLIDRPWYLPEAREMTWIDDVRTIPSAFTEEYDSLREALGTAVVDAGLSEARIGLLDLELPAAVRQAVTDAHPAAELTVDPSPWRELVASPSEYDAELIGETASIADAGLEAVAAACEAGKTEREVCLDALGRVGELGAEFLHASAISTHVDIGSFGRGRSNLQPFLYTEAELEEGEMFWVDLIVCNRGYYVDCDRTICVGEPTAEQRELYDVCRRMYEEMVDAVEPGVTGGEVWERGHEVAADAGYGDDLNSIYLGHSTGITISESPVVDESEHREIRAGQFLNVEPGIFVPEIGSACIENTLHVTESGAEPINESSIDLRVV